MTCHLWGRINVPTVPISSVRDRNHRIVVRIENRTVNPFSVSDPDPHWFALLDPDADPGARKLVKINKNTWFPAFQNGFRTSYQGNDRYLRNRYPIFLMSKFNFLWHQSLTRIRIRIGVAPWIRIQFCSMDPDPFLSNEKGGTVRYAAIKKYLSQG